MHETFRIQDIEYVLKNQGNYQIKLPQSQSSIVFGDFFDILKDQRFIPHQNLTSQVIAEAKQEFLKSGDFRRIFGVLKKHNIPFHESFFRLLEGRKRRLPAYLLQQSPLTKRSRPTPLQTQKKPLSVRGSHPAISPSNGTVLRIRTAIPKKSTRSQLPSPVSMVMSNVHKSETRTPGRPKTKKDFQTIQLITALKKSPTKKRLTSLLPSPFHPETRVNVQVQKQQSRFYIPGMSDCLSVKYNRRKKTLYVETILWFKHWEICFNKKIVLKEIVDFLKEQANRLGCDKIFLDDQSYIPIPSLTKKMVTNFNNNKSRDHHPPFMKVLNTLSEGQTLYMRNGFFCLPKAFLAEVDALIDTHPESRSDILRNVSVANQAFSKIILNCVENISLGDLVPIESIPPGIEPGISIKDLAKSLKKQFQNNIFNPKQDIGAVWQTYDILSKATFARKELYQVSSPDGKKIFYPIYLNIISNGLSHDLDPLNLGHLLLNERLSLVDPELHSFDKIGILRQLLWSLSSSFSETAMYRKDDGNAWTNFHLAKS